jgi:hypothetical protein
LPRADLRLSYIKRVGLSLYGNNPTPYYVHGGKSPISA